MEKPSEELLFEIENIANNDGCFVSIIKYITFFIIGFILLWVITLKVFGAFGLIHRYFLSFTISIGLISYFIYKIINNSDVVYKLIFNDKERVLTLISGNTFDGIENELRIKYESLFIKIETKPIFNFKLKFNKNTDIRSDKLSQNRIVKIYNSNKLERTINLDLSGWCRHEKIDFILGKFVEISN